MTYIYLSGPMSGLPGHNFPAFRAAAERLRAAGYKVEDPADKGIMPGWAWEDYLRWDLRQLTVCDGVAVLPGWRDSRGASLETYVAQSLGMPVRTVEQWLEAADPSPPVPAGVIGYQTADGTMWHPADVQIILCDGLADVDPSDRLPRLGVHS